jgi:uncharacterized membrane protein
LSTSRWNESSKGDAVTFSAGLLDTAGHLYRALAVFLPIVVLVLVLLLLRAFSEQSELKRELVRIRNRLAILELIAGERGTEPVTIGAPESSSVTAPLAPSAPATPATPMITAIPVPPSSATLAPSIQVVPASDAASTQPTEATPPAASAIPLTPTRPAREGDGGTLEQLIGGIWLQNVGSVLLLLGVFLMIVWGYTTGRVGPPVLVVSGVLLGLAFVWRGDRLARSVPAFGHALIGIGLGIVYLTLYVGHFQLGAMPRALAFALITAVSIATVATGLRYRVATIAALGVIGAFVPQLLVAWTPMQSFALAPAALLAYLAFVDGIVFVLAASAGWSGLDLTALVLSAASWMLSYRDLAWSWPVQIGLAVLFTTLGLAPLPRLMRVEGRVGNLDLAVVALAPLCFLAASAPFMAPSRLSAGVLFLVLAIVQLGAALWVDVRRPRRDLWMALTGAAVLDLAIATERLLGHEHTPLAWTVEGALLLVLGARERGGWLRFCGSVVTGLGTLWLVGAFVESRPMHVAPFLGPSALRTLIAIVVLLGAAHLLARRRDALVPDRWLPEYWTATGNALLMAWLAREASELAFAIYGPGGWIGPSQGVIASWTRERELSLALWNAMWMMQAFVLIRIGRHSGFSRACGTFVGFAALLVLLVGASFVDGWQLDQYPILHPMALLMVVGIGMTVLGSLELARDRERLSAWERWLPECWALGASLALLFWSARESNHVARALLDSAPGVSLPRAELERLNTLRAFVTSLAWIVQAVALLVIGWMRRSSFLRWGGLALFGITLLKFVVIDLRNVDVFWRFLTAIAVGGAMLAISYAYQARARRRD